MNYGRYFSLVVITGMILGCGGKPEEPTGTVSGSVTLDDKPMPEGEVAFARPGRASTILEVKDCSFSGQVPEGTYRVEIYMYEEVEVVPMEGEAPIIDRRNVLPSKYNLESQEQAEISAAGSNSFEFSASTK